MSKFIKNFKEITKKDVKIAGGKGASLGEMLKIDIQVPPGFVILASAFERFLEETDLNVEIKAQLEKVNYQDANSVDNCSRTIRGLIERAKMPRDLGQDILTEFKKLNAQYVAVRSSATAEDSKSASWAGELETYLNTTSKALLKNVKNCWSSLFTQRAIFYRFEKKLEKTHVSVAVVIQKMINSEIAGICFTTHPVTKDKNQMIIEAGWGLGEAVVSGQVTPDSYIVDKRDFSILDINIAEQERMIVRKEKGAGNVWRKVPKAKQNKQKLTGKQIIELAKLCNKIGKHYRFPCDIEWAFMKGKFYITQSRPITTL